MGSFRNFFVTLFFVFILICMFSVAALSSPKLLKAANTFNPQQFPTKAMQIQVMPEFDYPQDWPAGQPSLLVGYYGTLVNKTGKDYSGEIEFKAPVTDKNFQIFIVAEFPKEGQPEVQRPFQINKDKGIITWKPIDPIKPDQEYKFVIEYYYNPIKIADKKSFSYSYKAESPVEIADIIFYAPVGAKEFTIDKKAMNQTKSEYGEEIYHYQYKSMKAEEMQNFQISYKKTDNKSTLSVINSAKVPNDANHAGATDNKGQTGQGTPPNDANHTGVTNSNGQEGQATPPNDANHAGLTEGNATSQVLQNAKSESKPADSSKQPIISTAGAIIIGLSLIIMGAFIFFGLRGRSHRKAQTAGQETMGKSGKKAISTNKEEQKKLRKMLLNGEIDQQTYNEKLSELS